MWVIVSQLVIRAEWEESSCRDMNQCAQGFWYLQEEGQPVEPPHWLQQARNPTGKLAGTVVAPGYGGQCFLCLRRPQLFPVKTTGRLHKTLSHKLICFTQILIKCQSHPENTSLVIFSLAFVHLPFHSDLVSINDCIWSSRMPHYSSLHHSQLKEHSLPSNEIITSFTRPAHEHELTLIGLQHIGFIE